MRARPHFLPRLSVRRTAAEHHWAALVASHRGISVAITDPQHRILWVNETFTRLTGYRAQEARGHTPGELLFFAGTDRATVARARELYAHKAGARFEVLIRARDGRECWLEADVQPLIDARGEVEGHIAIHRDVTEQVRVREAMSLSEQRMRMMIDGANLGTWELDVSRNSVTLNEAFCKMLGYGAHELALDPAELRELCHPADRAEADRAVGEVLAGRAALFRGAHRLRARDGTWRSVLGAGGILERAADGTPLRLFGVQLDLTEQQRADDERRRAAESLAVIAANVPGMIFQWRLEPNGRAPRFLYASPGARDLYGVSPEELMSDDRSMSDFLVNPEENTLDYAAMLHSAATLTPWHAEHSLITSEGELRWLEANAVPQRNADGSTTWTGYVYDVTRRKLAEQELRVSEEKLRSLYDLSPLGIALSDREGRFLQTNHAMEVITGYTREELAGMNWWDWTVDSDNEEQRQRIERLMLSGRFGPLEKELTRKDGARIPVQITGIMVTASDGTRLTWSMVEDIADRKRAEQRISFLAYHDPLTGLDNRLGLKTRLAEVLAASGASGSRAAVMMIDLDRFKAINDTLGHDAGDRVIAELARRIRSTVRERDIVARLGGDEFVVALSRLRADVQVEAVIGKVFEQLRGRVEVDGGSVHVTVSAGVSVFPADGLDGQTLMKRADIAMYAAKARGRDMYQIYQPAMTQMADQRLILETELRDALADGQFVLHYQPQMDTLTGRPTGVEALLRWRHPARGLIPPALFIPIAEETRLIERIGEWALATACREMRAWLAGGGEPLTVAVNLSPLQFTREDLSERIAAALATSGLPPRLLELEITESAAMSAPDVAARSLARLKQLGVSLAIDDFGTGHSSLARLKMFNVDRLKIDQSIVTDCTADAYDAALCRATIALGRALGLEVVAEGVETPEQWQFLAQEHCNSVQGYLFAAPMAAPEAFEFLRATLAAPRLRAVPSRTRGGR
ncbi:MAG TPA: EAL domain-containing protein [Steroidobacteraceae bacterium]|nr:EAL domain-containing protein [Steroidobacteraceae bacterium]